jgi:hypothetical protein
VACAETPELMSWVRNTTAAIAVAMFGAAPAFAAPAQCPGIVKQGGDFKVPLTGPTPVACTNSNCPSGPGSFVEDVIVNLCNLGVVSADCARCDCCKEPLTDLVAGTQLQLVGPDPTKDCDLGGRGQPIGEAALCLLRDLAKPGRSPSQGGPGIRLQDGFSIGIGDVNIEQHVGFLSFDAPNRRMHGFHAVSICVPALGCVDNQVQEFTATLLQRQGDSNTCGDYKFTKPWVLQVKADDTEHNLGTEVGPFIVYTPVGPVEVKPRFDYEANLEAITSPWAADNARTRHEPDMCEQANLLDVYTGDSALFASSLAAQGLADAMGWDSPLGLGGRDPDPGSMVWSPPALPYPPRPDLDFAIARDADEKRPVNRFHAGVKLDYGLDALGIKLNIPPLSLDAADVFITTNLDAAFASQFALFFDEGRFVTFHPDCKAQADTGVTLQSAVSAFAQLDIEAGVHIEFSLDLGFLGVKHFDFSKSAPIIKPSTPAPTPMLGPLAQARINTQSPPPPGPATYDTFESFSGGAEDGRAFVDTCLSQPPPSPQPLPTPVFTPGDPRDLLKPIEFPCNICLFLPPHITEMCLPKKSLVDAGTIPADYFCGFSVNGGPCVDPNCENVLISPPVDVNVQEVVFPVPQDSLPADQRWLCNSVEKSACFDLCKYDPSAAQPLVISQSAVSRIGPLCRDGNGDPSGGSGGGRPCHSNPDCDDGNPCTDETCVGPAEFGTCQYTANSANCDDGLFCDGTDSCALGICGVHSGNPCAAPGGCCKESTDTCAVSCPDTPCGDKGANDMCDDGSVCTVNDHCVQSSIGLKCQGTAAITCASSDVCTASLCQDVGGQPQCSSTASGACPPRCGNNQLDAGEQCDGTSAAACPGQCQADCSCPAIQRRNGGSCNDSTECGSGNCVDHVCCDTPCQAPFEQCNLPGKVGQCQSTLEHGAPVLSELGLLLAVLLCLIVGGATLRSRRYS